MFHSFVETKFKFEFKFEKSSLQRFQHPLALFLKGQNVTMNCVQFMTMIFLKLELEFRICFFTKLSNITSAQKWSGHRLYCCSTKPLLATKCDYSGTQFVAKSLK